MIEDENITSEEELLTLKEEIQDVATKEQELEAEVGKLKDQLLRTLAELENYRKRAEREREEMAKYAITGFARELLSVGDNLRRAIESVPPEHDDPEKLLKILLEGVEITEKELLSAFKKHAVEKIDPLGQLFDHHLHQAMFEVDDSDQPPGTIVHVLQPGYSLHGRLLRPALVGLAKGKNVEPLLQPMDELPK
jgi:molecular chaperone GrpE